MRSRLIGLLSSALIVLLACQRDSEEPANEDARRFRFTYDVELPVPPAGTRTLEVWIPVASDDPGIQIVRDLRVEADVPYTLETEGTFGNRMLHVKITDPATPVRLVWTATIERRVDVGQGKLLRHDRFLQSTRKIPLEGLARAMATTLRLDDESVPLHERARRLYDDVLNGMEYDKSVPGYGEGDFERSVTVCKGNCTDFHSRFLGVARAAGIPVRFSMGVSLKSTPRGESQGYHCWAHYHDGTSWHPVDISEADKLVRESPDRAHAYFRHLDANRITLSHGRDLDLAPRQRGEALNYFVHPHVEHDGNAVTFEEPVWKFLFEDVTD